MLLPLRSMDSSDASGNSDSSPLDSERFPVIQHRTCHIDELIWPESRRRFGGTLPHSSKRRGRMLQAFPLAFRGTGGRKLKQSKAAGIDDPLRTSENEGNVSPRIVGFALGRLPGRGRAFMLWRLMTSLLIPASLAVWVGAAEPASRGSSDHWAFQPVRRPAFPEVKDPAWVKSPIDAFILARLEQEGLKPAPEADRETLVRRLSLDLLGLPPTLAEVEEFVSDPRPDAYELLVDRLLASPHYGERWARHWLDQARYADSNGYTIDGSRSIWKYRDWVIQALQRDLPFDQFTIEQIAGDMLPGATVDQIIATGFHRNTLKNEEGGTDPEQFRVEAVADRVSTTSTVFLGLTVGCARCHDHK